MSSIDKIHTPCKNCVFAIYKGNTQENCELEYITKYQKITEILEAYDDEKEFYIINKKKCIGYREQKWFDNIGMHDASMEEKKKQVLNTNYLDYILVINLKFFEEKNIKSLNKQLSKMNILPKQIIFIRYQKDRIKFHSYKEIQKFVKNINKQIPWKIQTMLDDEHHNDILHNIVTSNKKSRFIFSIHKPCDKISKIIEAANDIVYNQLGSFVILSNKEKTALVFSGGSYRYAAVVNKNNIFNDEKNYQII
jgi:hypothetical protein